MSNNLNKLALDYKKKLAQYSKSGIDEISQSVINGDNKKIGPIDMVGVVRGVTIPKISSKGQRRDWSLSIDIVDPTIPTVHGKQKSVKCIAFRSRKEDLPNVVPGNIILMKYAIAQEFDKRPQFIFHSTFTQFAVYDQEGERSRSAKFMSEQPDNEILQSIKAWSKVAPNNNANNFQSRTRRPLLRTDEIKEDAPDFFSYIGMIVGFFPIDPNKVNKRVIKVTDFTVNPKPYIKDPNHIEDDIVGNIRPEYMLQCTIWGSMLKHCPEMKFGDYVFLDNCIRSTAERVEPLEISIRDRFVDPLFIQRLTLDDVRLKPLLKRKAAYDALQANREQPIEIPTSLIRSRVVDIKAHLPIKELMEKEDGGFECIRATIEKYKPDDKKSWLRDYCKACRKTFVSTIAEECSSCGNQLTPVYKAGLLLQDAKESKLVAWVFGKDADFLFNEYPARRLKENPSLWGEFEKYLILAQEEENRPYFDFGIKKLYSSHEAFGTGWNYWIVNTELVIEDD